MREKSATKLGVLRMLKAALTNATIEKGGADSKLTDAEAVQVIRKQVKQRQDSIESFEKGGRAELAEKEKEELSILQSYLPQGMSADEISKVVRETVAEVGASSKAQMGAVMKAVQTKVAGRADGKTLSAEVQKHLSGLGPSRTGIINMLSAIIVAAGSSERMGFDKLFALVSGKPVIAHTIAAFENTKCIDEIILVGRADSFGELRKLIGEPTKVKQMIEGGAARS